MTPSTIRQCHILKYCVYNLLISFKSSVNVRNLKNFFFALFKFTQQDIAGGISRPSLLFHSVADLKMLCAKTV